jgi:BMFP domain-containing protein YqiC
MNSIEALRRTVCREIDALPEIVAALQSVAREALEAVAQIEAEARARVPVLRELLQHAEDRFADGDGDAVVASSRAIDDHIDDWALPLTMELGPFGSHVRLVEYSRAR